MGEDVLDRSNRNNLGKNGKIEVKKKWLEVAGTKRLNN